MTRSEPLRDGLEHFGTIAQRLRDRRPAVFIDYDGTLTPIVERPELAVLDETMRNIIRDVSVRLPVAIVSGRDRADVAGLVGVEGLVYAGSHGFDISGPNGLSLQLEGAEEFVPDLDRAEELLRRRLSGIDGVQVERKRYAIAVHYRRVADAGVPRVERAVEAALADAPDRLRRTGGKKVFELRVRLSWGKGRAVAWLLEALDLNRPEVLPLYLGDDETDEDAFATIRKRGGIGVLVADRPQQTQAHYALANPAAAGRFLRALVGTVPS